MAAFVAGESHYVCWVEVATAYFLIVLRVRSRARTSEAQLFSLRFMVLRPFASHYPCFELSVYTLLIYTFLSPFLNYLHSTILTAVAHPTSETKMSSCFNVAV